MGVLYWREGRIRGSAVVNYPKRLPGRMGEELTYEAAVDIRDDPPPPEEALPDVAEPAAEPVTVRCRLGARLVAVSDTIEVRADDSAGEDGWRSQTWSPTGVLEWSWTVEPEAPGEQKVRLELAPAVEGVPDPATYSDTNRVTYESTVDAEASTLQRVWYWFQTDWNMLKAIATALGVAALGILTFSQEARTRVRALLGKD